MRGARDALAGRPFALPFSIRLAKSRNEGADRSLLEIEAINVSVAAMEWVRCLVA